MTFAVVPACGHSTRMGRPKLALPVGGRAVIEYVVAALRDGGVRCVVVVVGPHVPELVPLAAAAGAEVLPLAEPTVDMRATVGHGLAHIEERYHPDPAACWLLAPADHPAFAAAVVRDLLAAAADSAVPAAVPVHDGRRGHPTLFRWQHAAAIRALPPDVGVNAVLRSLPGVREVPVADPGVLLDLDTPADYARLTSSETPGRSRTGT
jgi:molybdenum cofactor cytidylyltransferase